MLPPFVQPNAVSRAPAWGPRFIAIGLALLLAAACWPMVPVVTSLAILTLGATDVTVARFRGTPAMLPAMLLHTAIYSGLYALFVGATLHATAAPPETGVSFATAFDLAASTLPMAAALQRVWSGLRPHLAPKR